MKKSKRLILTICFIAVVFLSLYFLLEYREDKVIMVCIGVILVIVSYLHFENVISEERTARNTEKECLDSINASLLQIKSAYKSVDIEKIAAEMLQSLEKLDRQKQKKLDGLTEAEGKLLELVKQQIELEKQGTTLELKYSKENAKQLAIYQANNTRSIIEAINKMLNNVNFESKPHSIQSVSERAEAVDSKFEDNVEAELKSEPEPITISESKPEPIAKPAPPEPEPKPEPVMPQIVGDPNKALSADEIAALFASVNPPAAEAKPEPPEPEPKPEPVMPQIVGDPNKALSADEIAALFASVNG